MTVRDFLSRRVQVRPILRVYSAKEEHVGSGVEMVKEAVERLFAIRIGGLQAIYSADIRVWIDRRYVDESGNSVADCGKTAPTLKKIFRGRPEVKINVVDRGDIFVSALNQAIVDQLAEGIKYSLPLSKEALSCINAETLEAMFQAHCDGALVVPLAIPELQTSILEGRAANTFCSWDNAMLLKYGGGFDQLSAKPLDVLDAFHKIGWSLDKNAPQKMLYYHDAGVEEVLPIAKMFRILEYPFVAPILPRGEGIKRYELPDPAVNPERYQQHQAKMATKLKRQESMLSHLNFDVSLLKGAVMPEYRHPSVFGGSNE